MSRFCGECGHSLGAAPVQSSDIRAIVREGAVEVLGFDRRLFATGRDLLLHPARVVASHLGARGNAYVHPLKLFLFLGGLYMLCLGLLQPFSFTAVADDRGPSRVNLTQLVFGVESAADMRQVFANHGLTEEAANSRFQERANAITPLASGLALVPMAMILGLLQRDRPRRDHFTFLVVMSNAIWLVSLLVLPISVVSETTAVVALYVGKYLYLAVGFFGIYGGQSRARSSVRFGALAVSDVVITSLVSLLLSTAILASILYP